MAANMPLGKLFVQIGIQGDLQKQLEEQRRKTEKAAALIRQNAGKFSAAVAGTVAAGTAAITGFVAAASPDAINTFTGSIQLLQGEIGKAFIPEIKQAALIIQTLRNKIKNMDEDTKENAKSWALWALGAGAAWAILPGTVTRLELLAAGLKTVWGWAGMVAANFNLATAAITAMGAGVLYLAYKLPTLQARQEAYEKMKTEAPGLQETLGNKDVQAILGHKGSDRKGKIEQVNQDIEYYQNQKEAAQKELQAANEKSRSNPYQVLKSVFTGFAAQEEAVGKIESAQKSIQQLGGAKTLLEGGKLGKSQNELIESMSMQPGKYSIEGLGQAFQQAALQDPLQLEIQQQQAEMNALFHQYLPEIPNVVKAIENSNLGAGK